MAMTVIEAEAIAHTLSEPSKMPGYAYSFPAAECGVGSKLKSVEGSVCSGCYADERGRYRFATVQEALRKRIRAAVSAKWVEAMVTLLSSAKVRKHGYFRWFDSGDVQNVAQLGDICEIARQTPFLQHWLPTREYSLLKEYIRDGGQIPDNLLIRLSAPMVDGKPPQWWPTTSTVHKNGEPRGYSCPAKFQGNKCASCRACWDKSVTNVSYPAH